MPAGGAAARWGAAPSALHGRRKSGTRCRQHRCVSQGVAFALHSPGRPAQVLDRRCCPAQPLALLAGGWCLALAQPCLTTSCLSPFASLQAAWKPWSASAVHTVADVAPLRWLQHVVAAVPLPAEQQQQAEQQAQQQQQQQQVQQERQQQQEQREETSSAARDAAQAGGEPTSSRQPAHDGGSSSDEEVPRCVRAHDLPFAINLSFGSLLKCLHWCVACLPRPIRPCACRRNRRRHRQWVPPSHHRLWQGLPPAAAAAVADVQPILEPALVPKVSDGGRRKAL